MGIYIVNSVSIESILESIPLRSSEFTREMVTCILNSEDTELLIESTLKVSLTCPVIGTRIKYPGRGINCAHVQCFDLQSYLMMNETKPIWKCPVCQKEARKLYKDNFFLEILQDTQEETEVTFQPDGSWTKYENLKKSESGYISANGESSEKMDTDECIDLCGNLFIIKLILTHIKFLSL